MKKQLALGLMAACVLTHAQQEELADTTEVRADTLTQIQAPPLIDNQVIQLEKRDSTALEDLSMSAAYDSLWLRELEKAAALYGEMYSEVTEAAADTTLDALSGLDTETLKERLAILDQQTPFRVEYNPSLERVIKSFLLRRRELMQRMLTASQFYFPLFEEKLAQYDLPLELKYLSIVESALNPRAKSRVGATGLWQFMYSTGRIYGLEVSSYVDERSDPILATEAACKYLAKLYGIFGDWDLALAAYNSGPGNVNKAIRRSGGYTNYWNIRRNLPRETAGYVPAFLATYYLMVYAEEHGLVGTPAPRSYFNTDTIRVRETITFDQISKYTGVSQEDLKMLNPAYKLNIIPKIKGKDYVLRLPRKAAGVFVTNEAAIYASVVEENAKREKPLPKLVRGEDRIRYRVRSGDYLGKIAERYGVGVSQIKRWNGLRSDNLRVGQRLTIYPRKPVSAAPVQQTTSTSTQTQADSPKVHVVKKGDTLWTISKKYPGVSVENLREWNGLSGNNLQPGVRLKLCNCSTP